MRNKNRLIKVLFCISLFCISSVVPLLGQSLKLKNRTGEKTATELYNAGMKASLSLNHFKAYEYFHAAIKKNPDYVDPIKELSLLLFKMRQYSQALDFVHKAQKLDRYDISLINLEGRIYIGLGEFENSRNCFKKVLEKESNNVDAKLGMSDLSVVYGTWKKAINGYQTILKSYPKNIRAMLSLVLIYDELEEEMESENFIKKSIRLYPDDVSVRYMAANHYRNYGRIREAKRQVELALKIDPYYNEAALLLSYIMLDGKEYRSVVELLKPFLNENEDSQIILYTLAYAYENLGKIDEAIRIYHRALNVRIHDEITRSALESCVIKNSDYTDLNRKHLAKWHFDKGDKYLEQSKLSSYFNAYRRGLQISSKNLRGLKGYAEYYRLNDNSSKYFSLLEKIRNIDDSDRGINDNYNIYKRIVNEKVALKWGINQFSIPRDEFNLAFFAIRKPKQLIHYDADKHFLSSFHHVLNGFQNIRIGAEPKVVDGFAEAFKLANENRSDYFFTFDIKEHERSIYIVVNSYYSKSGIQLDSFSVLETGNERVQNALIYVSRWISNHLPKKGRLNQLEFKSGIINLGQLDGIKKGDKLLIIRKGLLSTGSDGFSFKYDEQNILGTFIVTDVDDYLSEGTVEKRYYYDLINEEDHVIMMPEGIKEFKPTEILPPDLYKELLKL